MKDEAGDMILSIMFPLHEMQYVPAVAEGKEEP